MATTTKSKEQEFTNKQASKGTSQIMNSSNSKQHKYKEAKSGDPTTPQTEKKKSMLTSSLSLTSSVLGCHF